MFTWFVAGTFCFGLILFILNTLSAFGSKLRYQAEAARDWMGAGILIMVVSALVYIVNALLEVF